MGEKNPWIELINLSDLYKKNGSINWQQDFQWLNGQKSILFNEKVKLNESEDLIKEGKEKI